MNTLVTNSSPRVYRVNCIWSAVALIVPNRVHDAGRTGLESPWITVLNVFATTLRICLFANSTAKRGLHLHRVVSCRVFNNPVPSCRAFFYLYTKISQPDKIILHDTTRCSVNPLWDYWHKPWTALNLMEETVVRIVVYHGMLVVTML